MPSRLIRHRSESTKLKHSHSVSKQSPIQIHQDQQENGLLVTLLASDPAQDHSTSSPKPTSSRQRLSGLLHGRKTSRTSLSPASPATVNSNPMPPTVPKAASPVKAEPPTKPPRTTTSSPGQAQPHQPQQLHQPQVPTRMASTIRTVPSFDERDGATSGEFSSSSSDNNSNPPSKSATTSRDSAFSSSIISNESRISTMSQRMPPDRGGGGDNSGSSNGQKLQDGSAQETEVTRLEDPSGQSSQRRSVNEPSPGSYQIPTRESSRAAVTSTTSPTSFQSHQFEPSFPRAVQATQPAERDNQTFDGTEGYGIQASSFDSSVGKASIGKTGRVMNKLISENEALKRELQIERLRAEEAKQQSRMLEEKMERIQSDYESRLLEANVNKTLLARKERQVETLQATVDSEKAKATTALQNESIWKNELETIREESKREVEKANNIAKMNEARYDALSSHWPKEKAESDRRMAIMRKEIAEHLATIAAEEERKRALEEICDQKNSECEKLMASNKRLLAIHEEYKVLKDDSLKDIYRWADEATELCERLVKDGHETSDELKWALNVKKTIPWAE